MRRFGDFAACIPRGGDTAKVCTKESSDWYRAHVNLYDHLVNNLLVCGSNDELILKNVVQLLVSNTYIFQIDDLINCQKPQLHWLFIISVTLVAGMLLVHPDLYGAFQIFSWEEEGSGVFDALLKDVTLSLRPLQDVTAYTPPTSEEDDVVQPIDFTSITTWADRMDTAAYSILNPLPPAHA